LSPAGGPAILGGMDQDRDDYADPGPRRTGPVLLAAAAALGLAGFAGALAWFYVRDWFGK
jgi:hypothetical protein